jgi:hypothetical protein
MAVLGTTMTKRLSSPAHCTVGQVSFDTVLRENVNTGEPGEPRSHT